MEEFQKTIIQLRKSNSDQQQKFEEKSVLELHKQQLEFQQLTLQKTELQQRHFKELLVNGSNNSEKDTIYFPRV